MAVVMLWGLEFGFCLLWALWLWGSSLRPREGGRGRGRGRGGFDAAVLEWKLESVVPTAARI